MGANKSQTGEVAAPLELLSVCRLLLNCPAVAATSDEAPVTPVLSIARASGNSVTISWTGDGTLLEATTLAGPWTVSWSQGNPQTQPAAGSKFYQIGPP